MPIVNDNDIFGYFIGEEIVCRECIETDEEKAITCDDLIFDSDLGNPEKRYFCDRCNEEITTL